jgi:hypothetical protein
MEREEVEDEEEMMQIGRRKLTAWCPPGPLALI